MFTKSLSATVVALAVSNLVSAQTHTDCDPRKKKCKDAGAFGGEEVIDFTKSKGDEYLHTLPGTTIEYDDAKGAIFSMSKEKDAPTKASDDYIFFGELECEIQAAEGKGIVTSIVLQSDDLDEIDWEWVGGDNEQVQSNYFSKGDDSTYDRGGFHDVENPLGSFHKYGIVWTQEKLDWTIDGNVVRTLTYQEAGEGKKYPQSPMQIKIGTWVAGRSDAPKGTVEWAGGKADFSNGAREGFYKNCKIVDYMGGEKGATAYSYPDGYDGMWESVIIKKGEKSDADDKKSSTSSAAPEKSSAPAKSSSAEDKKSSVTSAAASATSEVSSSVEASASSAVESFISEVSSSIAPSASGSDSGSGSGSSPTGDADDTTETGAASDEDDDSEEAAGMSVRTNLALGAAGLLAAFML